MSLTPGPWTVTDTGAGYSITRRYETPDRSPGFEHEAVAIVWSEENACAIAALPDLLSALEDITTHSIERVYRTAEEVAEADACAECRRFRAQSWPPLGLCSTHERVYYKYVRINERAEKYHDGDLRQIARAALAKVRGGAAVPDPIANNETVNERSRTADAGDGRGVREEAER